MPSPSDPPRYQSSTSPDLVCTSHAQTLITPLIAHLTLRRNQIGVDHKIQREISADLGVVGALGSIPSWSR